MDFAGLNKLLLSNATRFLQENLPGGKIHGNEYQCATIHGDKGTSCSTNIKTGVGSDFSTGQSYGDLISLYALQKNITNSAAFKILSEQYNFSPAKSRFYHYKHGEPTTVWTYRHDDGTDYFFYARYDVAGEKHFCPFTPQPDGKLLMKGPPEPRPLYDLHLLKQNPTKPVLVVEGEKTAEAAKKLVAGNYIVTTWPFGTNAVDKVDWMPLYGRKVLIWPDADRKTYAPNEHPPHNLKIGDIKLYESQPGPKAALRIAEKIVQHAEYVKIINVGINTDRKDGWDAADAVSDGWTWETFYEWAKNNVKTVKAHEIIPAAELLPDQESPAVVPRDKQTEITTDTIEGIRNSIVCDKLGLVTSSNGKPVANMDNVVRVLEALPDLRKGVWYDQFHKKIFTTFKSAPLPFVAISDHLEYELVLFLQRQCGMLNISDQIARKALEAFARRNPRNQPKDWLSSLKWDGQPRISTFFQTYASVDDSEYSRAVSRNFFISMVARIFKPGCKADCMVILEGKQGKRKSGLLKAIAGPDWHTEAIESISSNNFYQALSGKLIVEFADLSTWTSADKDKLKQVLSNEKDTYRTPYDRHSEDQRRSSIFAGTTNDSAYLKDETGARRFWPLKTGNIDIHGIRASRNQLFAEAVAIYLSETPEYDDDRVNSKWWEVPASAETEQEERRIEDPWEQDIREYLQHKNETTMSEILESCLSIPRAKKGRLESIRVGRILNMFGFEKTRKREGSALVYSYVRTIQQAQEFEE